MLANAMNDNAKPVKRRTQTLDVQTQQKSPQKLI
jgi:hypothetical protein